MLVAMGDEITGTSHIACLSKVCRKMP